MIQQTTALRKISSLRKPIRVVRGGQGSAKTISILILIINHCSSKPDREVFIISAELTKMRLTVIKDFVKVMKWCGLYNDASFLAGTLYRFPNGSFIKFIGLDKDDVGKGLRSDVAYFNEVNKCDKESYRQVASRAGIVYADYNPDAEFFIDTDVIPREDCSFLQLTFEDNELLSERERDEIINYKKLGYNDDGTVKNTYWANLWQVYGLGNIGSLHGVIFENWQTVNEIPLDAEFLGVGLDFGFTNDPTAAVKLFKYNNELYIKELVYETGLTNQALSERLKRLGISESMLIVADSAEPKSIAELRATGLNVVGAEKGADSIRMGIDLLQTFKMNVTEDSPNIIKELRAYVWRVDKNGKSLNEPIDSHNHSIDALKYITRYKLSSTNQWDMYVS